MAKEKKRGRKMPVWRKWAKAVVGGVGTALGIGTAISPAIPGLRAMIEGRFEDGLGDIKFQYSGVQADGGWQPMRMVQGLVTVGVGIGLISLFRYLAKRV